MDYQDYLKLIKTKKTFAFSRFGDGEWMNIRSELAHKNENCDGNVYYRDLGDRLEEIVSEKRDYYLGMQNMAGRNWPWLLEEYKQDWVKSDIFHKASIRGRLSDFVEILKESHVVYIGNESLKSLPFINEFIQLPLQNCWLSYDSFLEEIKSKCSSEYKVFLFSAGMTSNVFIDDMWNYDPSNAYIDVGSVFDPYVGRNTRSYHKTLEIKPL